MGNQSVVNSVDHPPAVCWSLPISEDGVRHKPTCWGVSADACFLSLQSDSEDAWRDTSCAFVRDLCQTRFVVVPGALSRNSICVRVEM